MLCCCLNVQVQDTHVEQGKAILGQQVLADRARQVEEVQQLLQPFQEVSAVVEFCCIGQSIGSRPCLQGTVR
jgi:hypothetical protein